MLLHYVTVIGVLLLNVCSSQQIRLLRNQRDQGVLAVSSICGLGENGTEPQSDPIGIFLGTDTDLGRASL